jgi:CheY-like chemotaxis protein
MHQKRTTSLVADVCLEQAECFARLVEAVGHKATFVIHPLDALDAVEALQPDVVFVDISMPGIDGWALARMLRKRAGAAPRLIVAVSGHDEDARASEVFDAYLVKPVAIEAVKEILGLRVAALREKTVA